VAETEIICIGCPLGCRIKLFVNDKDEITDVTEYKCKAGRKYAQEELKAPVRTLTATVLTEESSERALLPVRTNKPIHKEKLKEAMRVLSETRIKPPVSTGQIIIANILGTGADLVASDKL